MRPHPVQRKRFSGNPGTSGATTTAPARLPPCPVIVNNPGLQAACEKLEEKLAETGASPQARFTAWADALQLSLLARPGLDCVEWLVELHQLGQAGNNESDVCIDLPCIDLDELERICNCLAPIHEPLPIYMHVQVYGIGDEKKMTRLADILKCPVLGVRSLHLGARRLSDNAGKLLGEALQHKRSIRSLSLTSGTLGDTSMVQIAQALKGMHFLEELDLSDNPCGSVGLGAVAEALEGNPALRKLHLHKLGAKGGLAAIFDSLKKLGIEEIHLTFGSYSAADAKALGLMLGNTKTLKVLNIEQPLLPSAREDGAPALTLKRQHLIFDGLRRNSTLATLNLRGWPLGEKDVKALCETLVRQQCRLGTLYMPFPEDRCVQRALREAMRLNETLIKFTGPRHCESWIDAILKRNLERQAELPHLMPFALNALRQRGKLPVIPLNVWDIIGSQLDATSQLKVLEAWKGAPLPRPATKNDPMLKEALEELEDVSLPPQRRFSAWAKMLRSSLWYDKPGELAWLAFQHKVGTNCSLKFDACLKLCHLTPAQLEAAFDWLQRNGISLPVKLELNSGDLDNAAIKHFSTILRRDAGSIRSLSFICLDKKLSSKAVQHLADALEGNHSLQSLKFRSCNNERVVAKIAKALRGSHSIEEIQISDTYWGAASLDNLVEAIPSLRRLRKLTLSGFQSPARGLATIFESLMDSSIEEIELSPAHMTLTDATDLEKFLARTKTMTVLKLSAPSRYRRESASLVSRTVKRLRKAKADVQLVMDQILSGIKNSGLTKLDIRGWKLNERQVESLAAALLKPTCQLYIIHMTPLEDEASRKLLREAAKTNQTMIYCDTEDPGLRTLIKRNRKKPVEENLAFIFNHHHLPTDVCGLISGYLDRTDSQALAKVALRMPRKQQRHRRRHPLPINSPGSP